MSAAIPNDSIPSTNALQAQGMVSVQAHYSVEQALVLNVAIYGTAEIIDADPERAELSADVLAVVRGPNRPDPSSIVGWLDEQKRIILRITPHKVM